MIYTIEKIEIKTVTAGKENAGRKYISGTLLNKLNPWEETRQFVSFNQIMVERFSEFLPATKGGTAAEEKPIPEEMRTVRGCFVKWQYCNGKPFYKTYPTARTLRTGKAVNAGDKVCNPRTGTPLLFNSLTVFAMYQYNEQNEKEWVYRQDPDTVGETMFKSFCIPFTSTADAGEEMQEEPIF